jgi:hypothetical protein
MSILSSHLPHLETVVRFVVFTSAVLATLRLGAVITVSVLRFWCSELSDLFRILK